MGFGHAHHQHGADELVGKSGPISDRSISALKRALVITLAFMIVEAIGGYYANSLALLSDALHMLMDGGALGVSLFVAWVSKRQAPRGYTYGFQRVEILGALVNGLLIWLLSGFLIYESIERFQSPPMVRGELLFWVALVGLGANLASLYFLHRSSKENLNVKSAYLHVLTDSIGSVGVMIAGAVISMTGWQIVDPIVTVILAGLMLWSSWRLVREAVEILLERSPGHLRLDEIEQALSLIVGVKAFHDLHVWTLSSGSVALSVHLIGEPERDSDELLHEASHVLEERFAITHTTIQVEREGSHLSDHCGNCDVPREDL